MATHGTRRAESASRWRGGVGGEGTDRPLIGIAPDVIEPRPGSVRASCALTYAEAIRSAGGWPVILPPIVDMIPMHLARCDGFVLTGGDDPRMEAFGEPTHAKATPVHPLRQAFDTALLEAQMARPEIPVLGVCLGMQMMALVAGGKLDQHLPDTLASAERHWGGAMHPVKAVVEGGWVGGAAGVVSHHRQAVKDAGRMRVVAVSDDGVIEAIDRPDGAFFVGVQWHPERTADDAMGAGVFRRLVSAAAVRAKSR